MAEVIEMYGRYYRRGRPVDEVIDSSSWPRSATSEVDKLSGGQRRRLDLALALVGDPDLIFLDEPTTGFDPAARRQAWSTIRSLCDLGKTIFLTTHFMDEAQYLADRVAVMRAGEIIALGAPAELGGRDLRPAEIRFSLPAGWSLGDVPEVPVAAALGRRRAGADRDHRAGAARRRGSQPGRWSADVDLGHFSITQPTLEDIYLELTASGAQPEREEAVR